MGREVRRVPLDFDYPIDKVWDGFKNPYYEYKCPDCDGGQTHEGWAINHIAHLITMLDTSPKHPWLINSALSMKTAQRINKVRMKEFVVPLAGREGFGPFGHDALDSGNVLKKLLEAAGLTLDWITCKTCEGEGIHPDYLKQFREWKETPVPEGEGYQLWETTTEGSPQTPVFESLEALARYCADNRVSTFGHFTATYEQWLKMFNDNFITHQEGNNIFI